MSDEQRGLELVDEQRAGRVHRPEADEPFADVEPPNELHDPVGEIDELDRADRSGRRTFRHESSGRRPVAEATSSTGFSRTVTVELLLMRSSFECWLVNASRTQPVMLRKNNAVRQPCYTPLATYVRRLRQSRRSTPAATRSGCEAHTVPPL